jgi:hypothetical protein
MLRIHVVQQYCTNVLRRKGRQLVIWRMKHPFAERMTHEWQVMTFGAQAKIQHPKRYAKWCDVR